MKRFFLCYYRFPTFLLILIFFGILNVKAQCPTVTGGNSGINAIRFCAPAEYEFDYNVSFSPGSVPAGTNIQFTIDYGDGSANDVFNFVADGITNTFAPPTFTHTFPLNDDCSYIVDFDATFNGFLCTGLAEQIQVASSFNTDNENGGDVRIEVDQPASTNIDGDAATVAIFEICEGDDIAVFFEDLTDYNCNPTADPSALSNDFIRWTQFVYNTGGGNLIPSLSVDGVPVTNAAGNTIPGFADYEDTRGVLQLDPAVVPGDPRRRQTLQMTANGGFGPNDPVAGDQFEITLRYWNTCNPYDNNIFDGLPPVDIVNGDNPPIEETAIILIIDAPPPAVPVDLEICFGDNVPNFRVTNASVAGSTEILWYDGDPLAGGNQLMNPNGMNNRFFPSGSFPGGGVDNTVPGDYTLFVTYTIGGTGNCESEPVAVTNTVRNDLPTPTRNLPTPGVELCEGDNGVIVSINETPGTNPFGGDFDFQWTLPAGVTAASPLIGQSITVNIDEGTTGNLDFEVASRYNIPDFNGNQCDENLTISVPVNPRPTATVAGGGAVCAGGAVPAPDIIWTFTGNPPFDFIIDRPNPFPDVVINNHPDLTFTLSGQVGLGNYELTSLIDDNGCSGINLGGPNTVTLGGTPPNFAGYTVAAPVCDDGSGITPPALSIEITGASGGDAFDLQIIIDGGAPQFRTGISNGAGFITLTLDYIADLGGAPGTFPVELVQIVDASGCATDVNLSQDIIVNPVPTEPAAVLTPVIACTPDLGTTTLDVTISEPNVTVDWYPTATGVVTVPGGIGTLSLNPPSTGVFFAEARNTITGCVSNIRIPIEFIEDREPTIVNAGTVPVSCDPDFVLGASPVDNGGRGAWSVNGILYQENFSNSPAGTLPNGSMQDNDFYGWTVDVSDPDVDISDPNDRFEVFNEAFSIRDVDGEGIWFSSPIDITGVTDILFQMSVNANGLPLEAADFLQVNFSVDAGPESPIIPVLTATDFNTPINISEVINVAGASLQIIIRGDVNANAEEILFDNILVRDNSSTLSFSDPNDPTATLFGVPDGTTQTLTWNVTSEFGVCPAQTDNVTIIRNPLPEVIDPMSVFCEDSFGGGQHLITAADSTAIGSAIIGAAAAADRVVQYFDDPARGPGDEILNLTTETVSDGAVIFTRVTSLDVTPNCSDTSRISFTVNPQPVAISQSIEFCEDIQGGGIATGIDLTLNDAAVSDNQADRTVEWYTDLGRTTLVPDATNASATDGLIFFPRVINDLTTCFNDLAQVDITINPIPPDVALNGPDIQCVGNTLEAYALPGPFPMGTTFIWDIPADFVVESGGDINSENAILSFPVAVTDTIFVTRISPEGCVGNQDTLIVQVTAIPPTATIMPPAGFICAGDISVRFFVSPVSGTQYTWDVSNIPGASIDNLSGIGQSQIDINFGSVGGDLIVTPQNVLNLTCQGDPDTLTVVVNPNPILDPNLNATECSDVASGLILSSSPASPVVADRFNITAINVEPGLVENPGNAVLQSSTFPITNVNDLFISGDSFTNLTSGEQEVIYTVVPFVSATGCFGAPQNVTFTVQPEPILNALLDDEVCSDEEIGLQLAVAPSSPPASAWRILGVTVPAGLIANPGNVTGFPFDTPNGDTLMTDSYTNLTNAQLTVEYRVEPISTNNCVGTPSLPINIVINPEPVIAPIAAADRIYCSDEPLSNVILTTAGTGSIIADPNEYIFAEIITNGLTPSAGAPNIGGGQDFNTISFDAWTNETNATVQVIYRVIPLSPVTAIGRCAGDTVDIVVDILPEPVLDITSIAPVCSQDPINVTLASTAASAPSASFSIIDIRGNGLVADAGNINVASLPLTGQLPNAIENEIWINTTNASVFVEYDVVPVSADNCVGSLETIQILIQPEPVLDQGPFPSVCSGDDINVTLDVLGSSVNAAQFNIISVIPNVDLTDETIIGNTSAPQTGVSDTEIETDQWTNRTNGQRSVIYEIQPISALGCEGAILPLEVFIDPQPVGQDSLLSICSGEMLNIDLQGIVNLNNGLVSNFIWSAASEPSVSGESLTNQTTSVIDNTLTNITNSDITVNYTVIPADNSLNCQGDPFTVSVTVFPEPRASNTTFSPPICSDDQLSIDLQTVLNASGINTIASTFEWIATDNPNVTGESLTTQTTSVIDDQITNVTNLAFIQVLYEVTPTSIANGCEGNPFTVTVQILPEPQFNNTTLLPVCSDEPLNHVLDVVSGSEPAASFNIISVSNPAGLPGPTVTLGPGQSQTAILNDAWTNLSSVQESIFYEISPSSFDGCVGDTLFLEVPVAPEPVGMDDFNILNCSGIALNYDIQTQNIDALGNGLPSTFVYTVNSTDPANVPPAPNRAISSTDPITDLYTNTADTVVTVTYTIIPTTNTGSICEGDAFDVSFQIEPNPSVMLVNNDLVVCDGGNIDIEINSPTISSDNATKLRYDLVVTSSDIAATGGTAFADLSDQMFNGVINGTLTNSSGDFIEVTFTVTPLLNTCPDGVPQSTIVRVEPTPQALLTNNDPIICNEGNVDIDIESIVNTTNDATNLRYDIAVTSIDPGATGGTAFINLTDQPFDGLINGTLTNSSADFIEVTFEITPTLENGCLDGPIVSETVRVEPTPQANLVNNTPIVCNGGVANIDVQSLVNSTNNAANLRYSVAVSSTDPGATAGTAFIPLSNQIFDGVITGTLTNSSNSVVDVTFDVTPILSGCPTGPVVSETIQVEPIPRATLINNTPIVCNGDGINIEVQSLVTTTDDVTNLRYDVAVSSSNPADIGGSAFTPLTDQIFNGFITGDLTNSSNDVIDVTFTITPRLINGCPDGPAEVTVIQVEPTPEVSLTNNAPVICNGGMVDIDVSSLVNTTDDASNLRYNVSVTSSDPVSTTGSAFTNLNNQILDGTITGTLENSSNDFIDVTFTVTPILSPGCANGTPQITVVQVEPTPESNLINNSPVICNGDNVDIQIESEVNTTDDASNLRYSISVTSDNLAATGGGAFQALNNQIFDGAITDILTNSSDQDIEVTFTITPMLNGCPSGTPDVETVIVEPTPEINVIQNGLATICNNGSVDFTINSPTVPNNPGNLRWSVNVSSSDPANTAGTASASLTNQTFTSGTANFFGDLINNSDEDIQVTYEFTPQLTSSVGNVCPDGLISTFVITVEPTPEIVANLVSPMTICSGDLVQIDIDNDIIPSNPGNLSLNVVTTSPNFAQLSGAGIVNVSGLALPTGTNTFVNGIVNNLSDEDITITYEFTPTLSGCPDGITETVQVIVEPVPQIDIVRNNPELICNGDDVNIRFTSPSIPSVPTDLTFDIDVSSTDDANLGGAASIDQTGLTFPFDLIADLTNASDDFITVTFRGIPQLNGCPSGPFEEVTVIVEPTPSAIITLNSPPDICGGETVSIDVTTNTVPEDVNDLSFNLEVIPDNPGLSGTASIGRMDEPFPLINFNGTLINQNPSGDDILVTFRVTPLLNNCPDGVPVEVTVNVQFVPIVQGGQTAVVCSGEPINYEILLTPPNSPAGTVFNWPAPTLSDGSSQGTAGVDVVADPAGTLHITDAIINTSSAPITATYNVTPRGPAPTNCVGVTETIVVTILPEPVIDPNLDNTVCSGETSGISLNTNGTSANANEFRLESINVDAGLVPGGTNINPATLPLTGTSATIRNLVLGESFRNLELTDLTVEYTVVPISAQMCEGNAETIVLTIEPQPSIDPTISPVPVCSGEPLNLMLGEDPGNSIIIDSVLIVDIDFPFPQIQPFPGNNFAGEVIGLDSLLNDRFLNTTSSTVSVTYTLIPIAGPNSCRGDEIDIIIDINQAPELADNLDNTVCSDDVSGITFITTGTSEPAVEYFVDNIIVPAALTPAAGNFDFITSSPTADVNAIQNDSYTNNSNTFQTVQYFVRPNSAAGCDGPLEIIELTVEPVPIVDPSVITAQTVCGSDPLGGGTNTTNIPLSSPTVTSSGDQTNNISYNILAVPSSPLVAGFIPFQSNLPESHIIAETLVNNSNTVQTVTFTVTPQASGAAGGTGCPGVPYVIVVTVEPRPQLAANLATICSGDAVNLLLAPPLPTTTTGGVDNIEYIIDGVTGDVGNITGISPLGTSFNANTDLTDVLSLNAGINSRQTIIYEFRPRILGSTCDGLPSFVTVNVDPIPVLTTATVDSDGMINDGRICSSSFITIELTSTTDASTTTFYTWTSTSGPNVVGATDQATPIPVPFIFQSLTNTGTSPETVEYTITPQIISTQTNNCTGPPVTVTVTVDPVPDVIFIDGVDTVGTQVIRRCSGDPVGIELEGRVANTNFDWVAIEGSTNVDTGTGVNGDVINTVFTNTSTTSRTIVYSATPTGPGDTQCAGFANSFVVIVSPEVSGTIAMDEQICIGTTTFLNFQFTGTPPFEFVYTDGTSNFTVNGAISPALLGVTPSSTTTYELLSVTDFNNCSVPVTGEQATITVVDLFADLNMLTPNESCDPFTAQFEFDQRQDVTYTFDWGDGQTETFRATSTNSNQLITHPFENLSAFVDASFMVTLTVTQPELVSPAFCSVTADTVITVFNDIIVEVTPASTEICGGETIILESLTRGQTEESWSIRDAGDTNIPAPFATTAFADITLENQSADTLFFEIVYQARDALSNCSEQQIIPVTVFPEIVVDFTVDPLRQTFPDLTFNIQNNTRDRNSFAHFWDFGDGTTSNDPNITSHTYETFGTYDITLRVENAICFDEQTIQVIVDPSTPIAAFSSDTLGCSGQTIFNFVTDGLTMGVDDQSEFAWNFGDGVGTSFLRNPSYTYQEPGQFLVTLTVTNSAGRSDIANALITVALTPTASFVYAPIVALLEADPDNPGEQISEIVRFNNQSIGGTDFTWDFGDGNTANEENTTHQYSNPGLFDVSLLVSNVVTEDFSCTDDLTITDAVLVRSGGSIEIPNAFTPDPSGPNGGRVAGGANAGDAAGELENNFVFLPRFTGAVQFQMEIFNKWGERIFISNDQTLGWDGFIRGQRAEQGVYLYRISVIFVNGEAFTKLGDVTLIW